MAKLPPYVATFRPDAAGLVMNGRGLVYCSDSSADESPRLDGNAVYSSQKDDG